ncbi:MAG: DUF1801 domain-containing protein [Bacteroidia bacterium]|nr:DUF1801 domain-containing protein [Bacteroidia bacterium]
MKRYNTVDEFIEDSGIWKPGLEKLRSIIQKTELVEEVKWGMPVYTHSKKNIVGLGAFKTYMGLWFYQGALLADKGKKLINAQEGKTQAMRQWRFPSVDEIEEHKDLILQYVHEAIINQKEGREIKPPKRKPLIIPAALKDVMASDAALNTAFEALNLTMKREFAEYISTAKRESTVLSRLEKIKPMIMQGISLNDKYR